jgi:hypothetical protein
VNELAALSVILNFILAYTVLGLIKENSNLKEALRKISKDAFSALKVRVASKELPKKVNFWNK